MLNIPIEEKYLLTVEEAAAYFHIGENKLRRLMSAECCASFVIMNGTKLLIKRKKFEDWIDEQKDI